MTDAEKATLEHRIDELCAQLSTTQLNLDMWHDRAETMRNRLSAAQTENAKLLEQVASLTDRSFRMADKMDCLNAENTKLRSYCAEVAGILFNLEVDYCGLCDRDDINHPCPVHTIKGGECLIESELRELGIGKENRNGMEA